MGDRPRTIIASRSREMTDYRYIGWKLVALAALGLAFFLMVQLGAGAGDPVHEILKAQEACKQGQVIATVDAGQPTYTCQILVEAQ